ncbi:MAG: hypothetical protein NVS4B3_09660 [Gemmatimonadaceae bacterium]
MRSLPVRNPDRRPRRLSRARAGVALFIALGAMIIIGALIVGVHFAANQDFRAGRNSLVQEQALAAAEHGQNKVVANWNLAWNTLKTGDTVSVADTIDAAAGTMANVRVTKLNDQTFFLLSVGVSGTSQISQAQRRTGELVRLAMPNLPFPGALTTDSTTVVTGTAKIAGADAMPAGWTCPPLTTAHAAVAVNTTSTVFGGGTCATLTSCATGNPPVLLTPVAGDSNTYFSYGGLTWAQLIASADKVYPAPSTLSGIAPVSAGPNCTTSSMSNWGDVNRNLVTPGPCESYFPTIYAQGDLQVSSGSGQGLLLVQGNLHLNGTFTWYGPIIVRGTVATNGTGNKIFGGVMAFNQGCVFGGGPAACNVINGSSTIQYSSCAILNAFKNKVYVVAAKRSWADLY